MRNDLNLKGNELMAYALIYGFQKASNKPYDGTQDFIAEWLGISRSSTNIVLSNLEKRGLIQTQTKRKGCINRKTYKCVLNVGRDEFGATSGHGSAKASDQSDKEIGNEKEASHPNIVCEKEAKGKTSHELENLTREANPLLENLTVTSQEIEQSRVRKPNSHELGNLTQYRYNTDSYTDPSIQMGGRTNSNSDFLDFSDTSDSKTKSEFSKETCFKILKFLAVNKNSIFDIDLRNEFTSALSKVSDAEHPQAAYELAYAWNSHQKELERDGRERKFMPNLKKWLHNEAADEIKQMRRGKWYSMKRVTSTVDKIVEEANLA